MILIFSEESDVTTNLICDWLHIYNKPFLRINKNEKIIFHSFYSTNLNKTLDFSFLNKRYSINNFDRIWFRRGGFNFLLNDYLKLEKLSFGNEFIKINQFVEDEIIDFMYYYHQIILDKDLTIGNVNKNKLNKLEILNIAQKQGLNVPDFLVTTEKNEVETFFFQCDKQVISKAIKENICFFTETESIFHINKKVSIEDIRQSGDIFQITLFQKYYEKEFEVRVFYFNNDFYSMAIFSQLDLQTKEDYRNYNKDKPTRCLPFNLPLNIQNKLKKMFFEIGLNTGSIDLIYTVEGEFIFLEINPVGQFGIISRISNFQIERKIAMTL